MRASRSGATSPARGPCSTATTSRACRRASASTTSALPRSRGAGRLGARARDHGFCYYHYWFSASSCSSARSTRSSRAVSLTSRSASAGRTRPWSRRWDGQEQDVLQAQSYSEEDDRRHIAWLLPALLDRRAIRVEDKPLFLVYQGRELPDPAQTIEIWQAGGARGRAAWAAPRLGRDRLGCEGGTRLRSASTARSCSSRSSRSSTRAAKLEAGPDDTRSSTTSKPGSGCWPTRAPVEYTRYECVFPSWDNTPRRGDDVVGSPQLEPGGVPGVARAGGAPRHSSGRGRAARLRQRMERVGRRSAPRARPAEPASRTSRQLGERWNELEPSASNTGK